MRGEDFFESLIAMPKSWVYWHELICSEKENLPIPNENERLSVERFLLTDRQEKLFDFRNGELQARCFEFGTRDPRLKLSRCSR
jgi:hypothetical protein